MTREMKENDIKTPELSWTANIEAKRASPKLTLEALRKGIEAVTTDREIWDKPGFDRSEFREMIADIFLNGNTSHDIDTVAQAHAVLDELKEEYTVKPELPPSYLTKAAQDAHIEAIDRMKTTIDKVMAQEQKLDGRV